MNRTPPDADFSAAIHHGLPRPASRAATTAPPN